MATTTVYANSDDVSAKSEGTTYAAARDGTGTLSMAPDTAATESVYNSLIGGPLPYVCFQGLLNFDTAWLAADTPLSVVLSIWPTSGTADMVYAATTASAPPYTTADFIAGASLPPGQASLANAAFGAYNDFTDITLVNSLNGTGLTNLILFSKNQRDNVAPTTGEALLWKSADTAGTANDPRLMVYTSDTPGDDPGPYAVVHPPIAGERST